MILLLLFIIIIFIYYNIINYLYYYYYYYYYNINNIKKPSNYILYTYKTHPSQISFMGFCGTMGAEYMDYIIADNTVIPHTARPYYTEKVIAMPHSYFVNDHRQSSQDLIDIPSSSSAAVTRAQYGISEDKFVFCNFNQLYKIDPAIFDVWASLLKRVPNSILWLLRFPPVGEQYILLEARKRGVREDQIVFTDVVARDEHIKRGYLADLFLDTPVCNAHTTACDIL